MRYYYLLFISYALTASFELYSAYALSSRDPLLSDSPAPRTNVLLCCLDDSETSIESSFCGRTLAALYECACPMIVSASIMRTIFAHRYYNSTYKKIYNNLLSTVKSYPNASPADILYNKLESDRYSLGYALLLHYWDFDLWSWYMIDKDRLYLAVPKKMISQSDRNATAGVSAAELELGLRIDHLPAITDLKDECLQKTILTKDTIVPFLSLKQTAFTAGEYIVKPMLENRIFVSNALYRSANKLSEAPQWFVVIGGHGSLGSTIAYCSIADMHAILSYFDSKIVTRAVMLDTCYATGMNITLLRQNMESALGQTTYAFPLITLSMPDIVSGSSTIVNAGFKKNNAGKTIPDTTNNYAQLKTVLNNTETLPQYSDILTQYNSSIFDDFLSMPFLHPAHRTNIIPLFTMIEINPIFAQNRSRPLMLKKRIPKRQFGYTDALIVGINTVNISFEIDISGITNKVLFVSGILYNNTPIFHSIASLRSDLSFMETLEKIEFQKTRFKSFYIKKIWCIKNGSSSDEYNGMICTSEKIYASKKTADTVSVVILQKKFNTNLHKIVCTEANPTDKEHTEYIALLQAIDPIAANMIAPMSAEKSIIELSHYLAALTIV